MIVSVYLWRIIRAESKKGTLAGDTLTEYSLFPPAIFLMGATSFVYHASLNYLTQFIDFLGMYLYLFIALVFNFKRLGWITSRQVNRTYWLINLVWIPILFLVFRNELPVQQVFFIGVLVALGFEIFNARRAKVAGASGGISYKNLIVSLGLLALARLCATLDVNGVWCDPQNHWIQGHAAWHLLSAVSTIFLYRYYRQFAR